VKTIPNIIYAALALFAFDSAFAQIDATLYTKYSTQADRAHHTIVSWVVCGSLPGSSGCYGSGNLGPFGMAGAVLEGEPTTDLTVNTVTRAIYVLDIASGPNRNEVMLYVYTKVDTITTDSDTVTVTLSQTISLPLVSGLSSMAANKQFLFIGTDRSPYAVEIDKQTFSITQLGGFNPPINVTGITADEYGYATLSFGGFNSHHSAFIVVGPDGSDEEDGVGSQFMANTNQAVKITVRHAGIQAPVREGISDFLPVRRSRYRHDQEGGLPAAPAGAIDATLYTRYNMDRAHTSVGWNVCGSLSGSSGCYGSGSLAPFGRAGAVMEGEPTTVANTVTRAIYVLDIASGINQNEVVLYVYTKVDTITTDSDTVTVTLSQTISLPLVGAPSAHPAMAANNQFLFIGTDQSPYAVEIDKQTFSVTQVGGGFSPPINVTAILGDQYGYVTLSFGSFRSAHTGFNVIGPDGSDEEDGVGSQFMANIVDGSLLRP
jgi:hypothetical protein